MPDITDYLIFSQREIIDAYRNYDASDEAKEIILYFVSELTGLSVDTILASAG